MKWLMSWVDFAVYGCATPGKIENDRLVGRRTGKVKKAVKYNKVPCVCVGRGGGGWRWLWSTPRPLTMMTRRCRAETTPRRLPRLRHASPRLAAPRHASPCLAMLDVSPRLATPTPTLTPWADAKHQRACACACAAPLRSALSPITHPRQHWRPVSEQVFKYLHAM